NLDESSSQTEGYLPQQNFPDIPDGPRGRNDIESYESSSLQNDYNIDEVDYYDSDEDPLYDDYLNGFEYPNYHEPSLFMAYGEPEQIKRSTKGVSESQHSENHVANGSDNLKQTGQNNQRSSFKETNEQLVSMLDDIIRDNEQGRIQRGHENTRSRSNNLNNKPNTDITNRGV
ncbi:unnamed protein product, partial [Meganyctiphanes norvegica]